MAANPAWTVSTRVVTSESVQPPKRDMAQSTEFLLNKDNRIRHFRVWNKDGSPNQYGGITVACTRTSFAWSLCHSSNMFSKPEGRYWAVKYLRSKDERHFVNEKFSYEALTCHLPGYGKGIMNRFYMISHTPCDCPLCTARVILPS